MNNLVKITDLFEVIYGINLELVHLEPCNSENFEAIPFVSRTANNNGVSAYVHKLNDIEPNPAHTLSVAGGGSVLSTFYQSKPYYSGRDLYVLIPKKEFSIIEMLFYAHCISSNKYKYNYGRQANKTLKEILVPAEMPHDLKSKLSEFATKKFDEIKINPFLKNQITIDTTSWKSFKLTDLFDIKGSKTTPLLELEEYGKGKFPYVTTQATNNGIEGFYDFYTEEGNVLTIDSAVLGFCAYQPFPFSASDHVEKLIPKFNMDKYIALFFVTILNLEQYRYNYGRKCSQTRMEQVSIKLPCKDDKPDFDYMTQFIQSLNYSSSI
jgi:restriction endonuclease S subunit